MITLKVFGLDVTPTTAKAIRVSKTSTFREIAPSIAAALGVEFDATSFFTAHAAHPFIDKKLQDELQPDASLEASGVTKDAFINVKKRAGATRSTSAN